MSSENFEKFKFSFFDDSFGAHHNGADSNALLALEGDERKQAEDILINAIKTTEDDRPFIGVVDLKLSQASEIIKKRLSNGFKSENTMLWAVMALWEIERYPGALSIIINVYKSKIYDESIRWTAISFLKYFGVNSDVIVILNEAMYEEYSMCSYYAILTIKEIFVSDSEIQEIINHIESLWGEKNRDERVKLIDKLSTLLKDRLSKLN